MADVLRFKPRSVKQQHKGNTLCRNGHHKWLLEKDQRFDVKQGKLVTSHKCSRCGVTRNEAR